MYIQSLLVMTDVKNRGSPSGIRSQRKMPSAKTVRVLLYTYRGQAGSHLTALSNQIIYPFIVLLVSNFERRQPSIGPGLSVPTVARAINKSDNWWQKKAPRPNYSGKAPDMQEMNGKQVRRHGVGRFWGMLHFKHRDLQGLRGMGRSGVARSDCNSSDPLGMNSSQNLGAFFSLPLGMHCSHNIGAVFSLPCGTRQIAFS